MSDKMQKQNKEFTGIWIPKEIFEMEDLSLIEKVFLSVIVSLSTVEKGCTASNRYFADLFQISKKRASEIVNTLSRKKRIGIEVFRDTLTREIRGRVCTPIGIPIPQKVKEIEKSIKKNDKKVNSKRESNSHSIYPIDRFLEEIEYLKIRYEGDEYFETLIENFKDHWMQPLVKNPNRVLFQDKKAWSTKHQFEKWISNERN